MHRYRHTPRRQTQPKGHDWDWCGSPDLDYRTVHKCYVSGQPRLGADPLPHTISLSVTLDEVSWLLRLLLLVLCCPGLDERSSALEWMVPGSCRLTHRV